MAGTISSIASNYLPPTRPEAMEPPGRDTKNDNDKDDAVSATASTSAPRPTVNTQGQITGVLLNTQA
ncbi:MAG: hypothetical protein PHR30_16015 [Gallionellaceae bacterium]|nr:hypothetical protein [Gallionellaceae bacterium]MDD5366842.1 hypothetical protein [Gallionellaceae bacterium]